MLCLFNITNMIIKYHLCISFVLDEIGGAMCVKIWIHLAVIFFVTFFIQNVYADASSESTAIAKYADGKVVIMQLPNDCLIAIMGHDDKNSPLGVVMYTPFEPRAIFIVPNAKDADDATYALYKANDEVAASSDNKVIIGKKVYALTSMTQKKENIMLLSASLDDDLALYIKDGSNITVQLPHYNGANGVTTITFDLRGASDASAGIRSCVRWRSESRVRVGWLNIWGGGFHIGLVGY